LGPLALRVTGKDSQTSVEPGHDRFAVDGENRRESAKKSASTLLAVQIPSPIDKKTPTRAG
jgi:hypothetical protein